MTGEFRAQFDAEVAFANGGGLRTEGFRLDIPGDGIDDAGLAALFVRHLGLLMVAEVRITNKMIVQEAHKGGRAVTASDSPAAGAGRRLVELSHVITDGTITLPGWPAPRITEWLTREASREHYAAGTEFQVARIDMIANTGTYLDTPAHRYAGGADLAGTALDRLADLPGLVVRLPSGTRAVDPLLLAPYDVAGKAVLLHTGWDAHFGTDRYGTPAAPYLTGDGARSLVQAGAALVGIDSINIDDMSPAAAGERPAHSALLAAHIPIVEHLTGLAALPPDGFRFTAAPPRVAGMGTFPVRAFAVLDHPASGTVGLVTGTMVGGQRPGGPSRLSPPA
ncbi:cyclase family protein [Micromonospora sp. Llam7]|uniref:cyclase family protein n=1 Tax=Micromonospora tarapacensis TaxID=2835305 RepID=UPI001C8378CD|nr:cyclase family protein [Micromonospora tarapacensis]MBX7269127.1 cyclase family protein [Micromonospora tarapacensis]